MLSTQHRSISTETVAMKTAALMSVALTSNVISRTFFGICMTPESPSSPDTHTQGFDVVMALLSFLIGMMTARYGITERKNIIIKKQQQHRFSGPEKTKMK